MSGVVGGRAGALLGRHQRAVVEPLRSRDWRQPRDADALVDRLLRACGSDGGFVVALRDGIWLADADGTLERKVAAAPYEPAHHRFNDGRCDPQGRLFAGTMNEKRDAPSAALYRIDPDFRVTEVLGSLTISNGLAWSPDGRTMYHADTPTLTINAFAFDATTGTPSNGACFARFDDETDRPDGARRRQRRLLLDGVLSAAAASCGSRPRATCSRRIRSQRCARRCARSAAPTCGRSM